MAESSNPYAAPDPSTGYSSPDVILANEAGMVNQVTIIGILQIVLGIMELAMAGMLIAGAFFFAYAMAEIEAEVADDAPPEMVLYGMQAYYWITGGLVALFSIMRIGAGIGSFWFKGRLWMLISLIGGMLSVMTCYCAPFSIGLGIYGLVVMFNQGVVKAYRLAASGLPASEIRHRFMSAAYSFPMQAVPTPPPPGAEQALAPEPMRPPEPQSAPVEPGDPVQPPPEDPNRP